MPTYTIQFDAEPNSKDYTGPNPGRKSSERKMKQSVLDYLTGRIGASGMQFVESKELRAGRAITIVQDAKKKAAPNVRK